MKSEEKKQINIKNTANVLKLKAQNFYWRN